MTNETQVGIYYNNETGVWLFSVYNIYDPSYWYDSFLTYEEAKNYCNCNNYKIMVKKQ